MHKIELEIIDFRTMDEIDLLVQYMRARKGVSDATARLNVSLTVRYDANRITPAELDAAILECRDHCKGHFVVAHACEPTADT